VGKEWTCHLKPRVDLGHILRTGQILSFAHGLAKSSHRSYDARLSPCDPLVDLHPLPRCTAKGIRVNESHHLARVTPPPTESTSRLFVTCCSFLRQSLAVASMLQGSSIGHRSDQTQ
jgi:hypothetical protein